MTQHITSFLQECITITDDGSLASGDELEGLYVYWCSLRGQEPTESSLVVAALQAQGVEVVAFDGVESLEGLVLTGPVMAEFILACDFSGAWGAADLLDVGAPAPVASAS